MVDSLDKLISATSELSTYNTIGVDIENNNTNSYEGFTCLVQISAYPKSSTPITYLFDILNPLIRQNFTTHIGHRILENPQITKIMQGCL